MRYFKRVIIAIRTIIILAITWLIYRQAIIYI